MTRSEIRQAVYALENKYKKECAATFSPWKKGSRANVTVKVNWISPDVLDRFEQIVIRLYNRRNNNDRPWFQPEQYRKSK